MVGLSSGDCDALCLPPLARCWHNRVNEYDRRSGGGGDSSSCLERKVIIVALLGFSALYAGW